MGGAVLTTGVLATSAMAYAMHVGLHLPWYLAAAFSPLWGLAIANGELLLVSSARRQKNALYTFSAALPRLVLAGLSGAVVSVFLVLQLFSSSITAEIPVVRATQESSFQRQLANDPQLSKIPAMQAEKAQLEHAIATGFIANTASVPAVVQLQQQTRAAQQSYFQALDALTCEVAGTCTDHHAGKGPVYQQKKAIVDQREALFRSLKNQLGRAEAAAATHLDQAGNAQIAVDRHQLAVLKPQLATALARQKAEESAEQRLVSDDSGLLIRLEALDELSQRRPEVNAWRWLIAALLMALECLPILAKVQMLMGKKSLFEQLQDQDEKDQVDAHRLLSESRVAGAVASADIERERAERGKSAELEILDSELRAKVAAHKRVSDRLMDIWVARRMAEIEEDPDRFVV